MPVVFNLRAQRKRFPRLLFAEMGEHPHLPIVLDAEAVRRLSVVMATPETIQWLGVMINVYTILVRIFPSHADHDSRWQSIPEPGILNDPSRLFGPLPWTTCFPRGGSRVTEA